MKKKEIAKFIIQTVINLLAAVLTAGKRPNLGSKISTSSVLMRISRDCKEVGKSLFLT